MPKPPPCRDADGEQGFPKSTGCSGVFGVRGAVTHLSGVNSPNGAGLMVSAQGEEYIRRGIWSTRDMHRLAIGGGGAGFEGTLLGGWAGGVRIPVGNHHGPVLRAGLFGYLRGNNAFYESLLELPQIQAGYQYLRGGVVLELGATTGAVLTGKSRTGEMTARELGAGFEIGGYAMARTRWFRLGVSAASLPVNDGLPTAVRIAEGTLCALLSPLAICADARGTWTDAVAYAGAAPSEVRSLQAGLTVGFTRE